MATKSLHQNRYIHDIPSRTFSHADEIWRGTVKAYNIQVITGLARFNLAEMMTFVSKLERLVIGTSDESR